MSLAFLRLNISVCLLLCALHSSAQELIPVGPKDGVITLGEVVSNSSMIVKLRVVSTTPVLRDTRDGQDTCGFLYAAKVLDTLKGMPMREVTFFAPSNVTTVGTDMHYLAFLKYRSEREAKDLKGSLSDIASNGEDAGLRCKFLSGYYLPVYLTLMPFDLDAARQFGGEWLSLKAEPGKPHMILCQVAKNSADKVEDRFHRRKKSGGYVTSWTEASRLIKKADGTFSFLNRSGLDECAG